MKRFRTEYPGVFYREAQRIGGKGTEKIYYVIFKKEGKIYEEKIGRQYADEMTPSRAARIRADRIEGRRLSRKEIRQKAREKKWTFNKLWKEYEAQAQQAGSKSLRVDELRFNKHLKPKYGDKEPSEIHELEVDRLRINLLKTLSPQTVKHVLALLRRLSNFAAEKRLCPGVNFDIKLPRVDNIKTEDLSAKQLKKLLQAIKASEDIDAGDFMRLALFTGARRGELIKLKWKEIDFDRGFINIVAPKGGISQKVPLSEVARGLLLRRPRKSEYVFCRKNGLPYTNVINKRVRAIRDAAGLPSDFRPLHGLRHVYASMLASSGQVDMYTLQKLLTHKDPKMTQRYAHLRDETLKRAADLAGQLVTGEVRSGTE
ncbi:MAG: tyrosine-type recombinase/integrase [Syntrophales bacterium]